jgi:C1A family cysteine protease
MKQKPVLSVASTILILLAMLISVPTQSERYIIPVSATHNTSGTNLTMRNPAAVYCLGIMGYEYRVVDVPGDGQMGICILPNREECNQWDFYAGVCGQSYSYCAQQGYRVETRNDGRDPFAPQYAVCVSSDGRVVDPVARLSGLDVRLDATSNRDAVPCEEEAVPDNDSHTPSYEQPSAGSFPPYLPPLQPDRNILPTRSTGSSVPSSFDWRSYQGYNWLTGVKNQGGCGSCWAFAAVGVAEAYHNIMSSNPNLDLDLAEQDLVSCSGAGSCGGGSSTSALQYIRDTGIVDENCLPYTASDSSCNKCSNWQNRLTYIDETHGFSPNRQSIQQNVVDYGPTYAYMGIGSEYGGYFDGSQIYRCSDDSGINHAVTIVGYNNTGSYWIVRNSWGSDWNGDGYFKVGYDECGIDTTWAGYAYNIPPTGQITSLSDGAFLNEDSVYIEAEASDNNRVDQVQFFAWYDNDWHYIGNDTDGSDGYQTTWDVSSLSDRSGIWLDALILDLVWNRWDATVGNLTLDRTPPAGQITSPSDDSGIGHCPLSIQAEANDSGSGVDFVEFHAAYDGSWHHLGDDGISPYSWEWDCSSISAQGVWLTIHVWDNAGNEVIDPGGYVYVTIDTTPPSGQILTPADGAFLNEDSVYIEAEASDNLGIDQVQFFAWYDNDWHYIGNDTDGSDGYQTTWDVSSLSDRSGIWLDALILDLVWNRWDATVGNLTLDRTPPTGSVSVNSGATYAASTAVTLNLVGTDEVAGVGQVMASNDAGFSSATWVDYVISLDWTLAAGDGTKTVYTKFRDRADNVSSVYSDTIILDVTPPTGSILIQEGAEVISDTQVTLTVSASDTYGITHMRLRNDTAAWSVWEPFATGRSWILPALPGTHTVWVQFQDPAGNVSAAYSDSIVYQFPYRIQLPLIMRDFGS